MQNLFQISGFASLTTLEELAIVACSKLESIDGLSRLTSINKVLLQHNNRLCYIVNDTADAAFWQVSRR